MSSPTRFRPLLVLTSVLLLLSQLVGASAKPLASDSSAAASTVRASTGNAKGGVRPLKREGEGEGEGEGGEREGDPLERDYAFYSRRIAGTTPLTVGEAAVLRARAAQTRVAPRPSPSAVTPQAFAGAWTPLGPNPIVQALRGGAGFGAMSGRISALAIRSTAPYTMYLGGAQGGVWISSTLTTQWQPVGDNFPSLAVGAIALAPSNENTIYVGTGEGALSGDSYFGVGVMKSTDGGRTWAASATDANNPFKEASISKIVVDPTNPQKLWVATIRGRGGARRTSPVPSDPKMFGIWFSQDGGATWSHQVAKTGTTGGTDLVIDPLNPNILLASFWTEGISKTVDGGTTWTTSMNGLPAGADYQAEATRFALGISHPSGPNATVYAGFEYDDSHGNYQPSTIWKSTDGGSNWAQTNTAVVGGYCGTSPTSTQCTYDNTIGVDPQNANIVYALGLFNYGIGSGGIYRSLDGGATWRDLGYGLHPDYHAIAIRKDAPQNIVIGNDGGVWSSSNRGGRLNANDPVTAVDWKNLNGTVDQDTLASVGTGLQITQFTSIAQNPTNNRVYGGTQDNGTQRKTNTAGSGPWFDFAGGDGGQVLVDPNDPNFVYGTYYYFVGGPYRFDEGMQTFGGNNPIQNGIDTNDRSDFYVPFAMDPEYSNRLYLGSFRVYRTDNANAPDAGDVLWKPISGDLTSGCTGSAPNGARNCSISALGVTAGGPELYAGTLDGRVWKTDNANVDAPTWTRVDTATTILPLRPVGAIAVDRSNYRVAYLGYNGFDEATPGKPGHVFKTADGGATWKNITGNLADVPVNSLVIDPSLPNTIYAATDVGPYITTNANAASPTWAPLGTGFPIEAIWQLDLNPFTRRLVVGTHGRGAFGITDSTPHPALQVRKLDSGIPIGPNQNLTYSITVKNTGNLTATGVTIVDPLPANTTFVSASNGGSFNAGNVTWSGLQVPMAKASDPIPPSNGRGVIPGTVTVTLVVKTAAGLQTGNKITNDGITVASNQVATISGSPQVVTIAPANAVTLTPATQTGGARPTQSVTYTVQLQNLGFNTDKYNLTVTGNSFPTTFWNANFTQQITRTGDVAPGATTTVGVKVTVPANSANGRTDTATIKATSVGNPTKSATGTIKTIVVTKDVLLVDNDAIGADLPDVSTYYKTALAAAGYADDYNYWDLEADPVLPLSYMKAHKAIVWFTGASYPGPLLPYEGELAAFLDGGGKLFVSGQDILDQAAGTTEFVHDYLHIEWDGSETQNDIGTATVTAVPTNTVMAGLGTLPLDVAAVLGADFSDEITPIAPAVPAFRDDTGETDALTVAAGNYKVVFLAWPLEALTSPTHRAAVLARSLKFFGLTSHFKAYFPVIKRP